MKLAELFSAPQEGEEKEPEENPEGDGSGEAHPLTEKDLTLPEGTTYDGELGKSFLDVVNDSALSRREMANRLVSLYSEQQGKMLEALKASGEAAQKQFEQEMKREREDWMKQCQADPEIGGLKWEAAQTHIDRACRMADPELIALLERYNLNCHPAVARFFARVGKLAGEDRGGSGGNATAKRDPAEILFSESLKEYHARKGD